MSSRNHQLLFIMLAASFTMIPFSAVAAAPVNSLNDGRIIQGGTYYNTSSGKTTFVNSGSGGLWLKSGTTVRGLEVNANGSLTNHGGTMQLYAPGNVVRIDGNINVSGLVSSKGAYLGDGGKVFVDAGYLYQNGNIFANGKNGGLVQMDVNAATLGSGAQIQAKGLNGAGGVVNFASTGPVDLRQGSSIDTSGWTVGAFDRNVINIEGGMIVHQGILKADGIAASGQGARGGTIRLVSTGRSDQQDINDALNAATFNNPGDTSAPTLSHAERDALIAQNNDFISHFDGGILEGKVTRDASTGRLTGGLISANGSGDIPANANDPYGGPRRAGDGGTIIMSANRDINLYGITQANGSTGGNRINPYAGGNGGTISLNAESIVNASGSITQANGAAGGSILSNTGQGAKGGDGGLITLSFNSGLEQSGLLQANGGVGGRGSTPGRGGQGGLVLTANGIDTFNSPSVTGLITANGALGGNSSAVAGGKPGTVVISQLSSFQNPQNVQQKGFINGHLVNNPLTQSTQARELLTHGENLISLVNNQIDPFADNFFTVILPNSTIRSVYDPTGSLGTARQEVIDKNTATSAYVYRNLIVSGTASTTGRTDINFEPPNASPSVLSRGRSFSTLNTFTVRNNGAIHNWGEVAGPTNFWVMGREHNIFGGGHIALQSLGFWIWNDDDFQTKGTANSGSVLLTASDTLNMSSSFGGVPMRINALGGFHGGNIQFKSGNGMFLDGDLKIATDGRLMGGTVHLDTGTLGLGGVVVVSADATARGAGNPQAGNISFKAAGSYLAVNNGLFDVPPVDGEISHIHANAPYGRGGYVQLNNTEGPVINNVGIIEANGQQHGGVVALTGRFQMPFPDLPHLTIGSLTPPKTNITNLPIEAEGAVVNLGQINALGKGGRIYLGGNDGVLFSEKDHNLYPNSPLPSLNGQPVLPSVIFNSSNPNATLQAIGQKINVNGQQVYVVAGNELTNKSGQTRSAMEIVNAEAAANHSAPNVNPNQDGQGAAFTQDFQIPPNQ